MHKHIVVLLLGCVIPLAAQNAPVQKPSAARPSSQRKAPVAKNAAPTKSPEAMVDLLLPDNVAYPERLSQMPAAEAVSALTNAQTDATGAQADGIAYLLVILGHDADANRRRLTASISECSSDPENCDDRVIAYAGDLFQRGDALMLEPLLDAAKTPALAEILGGTYDDMLARAPRSFMTALSNRPEKEQQRLCRMVASGDGAGLPDESAEDVESALQELAAGTGAVSRTAMMCLSDIRAFAAK
jgi:hypothetical protein